MFVQCLLHDHRQRSAHLVKELLIESIKVANGGTGIATFLAPF
jgi:hypothetical protein